jgi:protocatechuate 3,4-dioxygenase beta subunit
MLGDNATISGRLTDEDGNPIANATVVVIVNGTSKTVKTDEDGNYKTEFPTSQVGTNLVKVEYMGDDKYEASHESALLNVIKEIGVITVNVPENAKVGDTVNIKGTLTDENGNPLKHKLVKITVNGKTYETYTDENGNYSVAVDNLVPGKNNVTASVDDEEIEVIPVSEDFNVTKRDTSISIEDTDDVKVGDNVNIRGRLIDEDGNPVTNADVTVTVDGVSKTVTTDSDGNYVATFPTDSVGTKNITVEYEGSEEYNGAENNSNFNVIKRNAIVSVDPVNATSMDDNISITGKLTDENGTPIADAVVTITINGEDYNVTTDSDGNYELPVTNAKSGLNNVTVKYENDDYNTAENSTNFTLIKVNAIVTVDPVEGIVGEEITLVAHVTDEDGNNITGGNLVFKLNGRTLREDGRFDTDDAAPMKFHVENGLVTYTMTADLYLRSGKNITASYSGTSKYNEAKANVATASIKKRNAELTVTVLPETVRQNTDAAFIVQLRDVTPNGTNETCITTDAGLILKVNGVTLNNTNGETLIVPVDSTTVTYMYHVPSGTAGVYSGNYSVRDYTVEAVYTNDMFYPDTRNNTVYHVERSEVNLNYESVTVKNNMLSIRGIFTDYQGNLLVGYNKICVKINGITYQENNETRYFDVYDGKIDLSGLKVPKGTKVKSVTVVTGDRQAYLSARVTTTDIKTS